MTIEILVNKAFTDDWFNKTYGLNLQQDQLARLLEIATTNQLFQFNGQLYQQTDGVAMGSPLGPLMANVFMCHLEEKLTRDGLMPQLYTRYVDVFRKIVAWLGTFANMLIYYRASVCSRYNARSDWLSAASHQGIILP